MISGIFESIERLMEYIPIDGDYPTDGHLVSDTKIDSRYYFKDIDAVAIRLGVIEPGAITISLREIIKLFNKFLANSSLEEIVSSTRYQHMEKMSGLRFSSQLLFDFCLAALDSDILDARIYLTHTFHILGLHKEISLLLSIILNDSLLLEDKDVRKMLTLLAALACPSEKIIHLSVNSLSLARRYKIYIRELNELSPSREIKYEQFKFLH